MQLPTMVASAGLWPLSSPLAGQKRPPILPGGCFLLFGGPGAPRKLHTSRALPEGNRKLRRESGFRLCGSRSEIWAMLSAPAAQRGASSRGYKGCRIIGLVPNDEDLFATAAQGYRTRAARAAVYATAKIAKGSKVPKAHHNN